MHWLHKNKKGFTMLEILVASLILTILVAISVVYYGRFMERMRIAEVDSLAASMISSQERHRLRYQDYTRQWHRLESSPVQVRKASANNDYANGEENAIFYTRGGMRSGTPKPGFAISFESDANYDWFVVARRVGHGPYTYRLIRPFESNETVCVPDWNNEKDIALCMDYMGVETQDELSDDPMFSNPDEEENP